MSNDQGNKPPPKNSLLSAAASGFSFEESAALLVPVSLQDEPAPAPATDIPPATAEIDLNSEEDAHVDLMAPSLVPVSSVASHSEERHTSALFAHTVTTNANDDPFSSLVPSMAPLTIAGGNSVSHPEMAHYGSPISTLASPLHADSNHQTQVPEEKVSQAKESFFSFGSFFSNAVPKVSFFSSSASSNTQKPIENSSTGQQTEGSQYPYLSTTVSNPYYSTPSPSVTQQQHEQFYHNASGFNTNNFSGNQQQYPPPTLNEDLATQNVAPVPLLTPSEVLAATALPPASLPATSSNSFRLGNQKRLSYAQYPGLTGNSSSAPPTIPAAELFPTGPPVMPPVSTVAEPPMSMHYGVPSNVPFVPTTSTSSGTPMPPFSTYGPESTISPQSAQSLFSPQYAVAPQPAFASPSCFPPQASYENQNVFANQAMLATQSTVSDPATVQLANTPFSKFAPAPAASRNGAPNASTAIYQPQQITDPGSSTGQPPSAPQPPKKVYHPPKFYTPMRYHWFYRKVIANKIGWKAFSMIDSDAIEQAFLRKSEDPVPTEGGRYDVDLKTMQKLPVYWDEASCEVKRCSWFYKGPLDSRFVPYDDDICERLEKEYAEAFETGKWNRRIKFPNGESITLHNPGAMSHICRAAAPDEWGNVPEEQLRPRVVKRGIDEFDIEQGESPQIDHLVLLVHGIGAICDFKFRSIVEAVDGFRNMSFPLMRDHFKEAIDANKAGRVEFLPISWHKALHGEGGIDDKLKSITLKSIPLLRSFTNDTLLDILFYTSPHYAQNIIDTVGNEMNRIFRLFLSRNPGFNGYVAIAGHSLGSLILFDLLTHQSKGKRNKEIKSESTDPRNVEQESDKLSESNASGIPLHSNESISRLVSYTFGPVGNGTGQPQIMYPALEFDPTAFFALGSPIAMFVTIRGIEKLGKDFHFPTCPSFFNIFHPFDPVAYRIETIIDNAFDSKPILIPHHKGRKRLHLEIKETMQRIGTDVKQKVVESVVATWNMIAHYTSSKTPDEIKEKAELEKKAQEEAAALQIIDDSDDDAEQNIGLGRLNGGRRVDFVLQEAPLESFNEYLFALSSHVCYWESEDTMLMILKEVYASMGVHEDKTRPNSAVSDTAVSSVTQTPSTMFYPDATPFASAAYPAAYSESDLSGSQPPTTVLYTRAGAMQAAFPSPVTSLLPPTMMTPSDPRNMQSFVGQSSTFTPVIPPPGMPQDSSRKPVIIGSRPVVSNDELQNLRGMDPTAPINSGSVGPPPLAGFRPKQ